MVRMARTGTMLTAIAAMTVTGCAGSRGTASPAAERTGSPQATASATKQPAGTSCAPSFDPSNFTATIDNPYYPLPVGRVIAYRGVREGQKLTDTVTVTNRKKVIDGVTTTVVTDVADDRGKILEQTSDYFAQDKLGNVWYLGEDTKSFDASGAVDTSGSWIAGVNGAIPGIIMLADPQIPCGYRQEYLKGEAEDTAWIVGRGATVKVPYGTLKNTVRSLEVTALEPDVVDEKIYAPGIGIVRERSVAGPNETVELVKVSG